MSTPAIITLGLIIFNLLYALAKHGEYKAFPRWNICQSLFDAVILIGLLYWGGFFD